MAQCFHNGLADGLTLNYARGFQERNLSFLKGLPIRRLTILARTMSDLDPVYELATTLTELSVETDERTPIDLGRLPHLRILAASWRQVRQTIGSAEKLEKCLLLSYEEVDLTPLGALTSLSSLALKDHPAVASLAGLDRLPWLTDLGIYSARDLEDLSELRRTASPTLQRLQLESCRRIETLEAIACCEALTFLNAGDCGDIASLQPIARLGRLESLYLYESTRIVDNDLTPITKLPRLRDFRMRSRRSYVPSVPDLQQAIIARN